MIYTAELELTTDPFNPNDSSNNVYAFSDGLKAGYKVFCAAFVSSFLVSSQKILVEYSLEPFEGGVEFHLWEQGRDLHWSQANDHRHYGTGVFGGLGLTLDALEVDFTQGVKVWLNIKEITE